MSLIDISRRLQNGMPVWPGDTNFSFELSWTKEESGSVNVGKLTLSTHTGTHIDAPFHFDENGKKVIDLDPNLYVGEARVIELLDVESIKKVDLEAFSLNGVKRLLIKTNSWKNDNAFPERIPHIEKDVAEFLKENGIKLLGIDVPSVDPLDSKELVAHHALQENGIHILESIDLRSVSEGDYELIALPLPLTDADGSPVRAVLRKYV
ncbi:arylformamidase [Gottfriedia solisilvae]|uniref:Kynurenine formamidase n=1 Tax=Gottfriedia solisilvae TaxID=1516104 RepID=A0A8J3EYH7_9BACI|nr:arylformamidase [Gottfriedia solisilvae]GGI16025.1 kynurenine formamidase [Gottfriedia solisilvae]